MGKELTDAEIDTFIERGWVCLEDAMPQEDCDRVVDAMWEKLDQDRDDPSTWTVPWVHVAQGFIDPPFDCGFTPRVLGAFDDLLGQGRWRHVDMLGQWPVLFPGFIDTWVPPTGGWHIDGHAMPDLRTLAFHKRALITLYLFTDVKPGGGGTAVDEGSHRTVAQVINEAEPGGMVTAQIIAEAVRRRPGNRSPRGYGGRGADAFAGEPCGPDETIVEVTGKAGDVILMHPHTLHAISGNVDGPVRFACNPFAWLKEPMRLDAPAPELSPVERAIVEAVS